MGWNYLSIPKLQRLHHWSLGMDKLFHPTLLWACNYLSMLGLKLNHVSKRGPGCVIQNFYHRKFLKYDSIITNDYVLIPTAFHIFSAFHTQFNDDVIFYFIQLSTMKCYCRPVFWYLINHKNPWAFQLLNNKWKICSVPTFSTWQHLNPW